MLHLCISLESLACFLMAAFVGFGGKMYPKLGQIACCLSILAHLVYIPVLPLSQETDQQDWTTPTIVSILYTAILLYFYQISKKFAAQGKTRPPKNDIKDLKHTW